ncbi:MAG: FHA domain-containing protein [Leptolyngbyaceae cyanobacterium SL_1_1]|nr:FHA domain-containing protein [Leptolyngbyaceae cyanobacterium RM1_1_2]NJO09671.1 FHA domain-containing protein [Leptolyngbyaceae cyanobacterium SL_1_1]
MIVCPNCSHQNPEGAVQCEACYTPLPSTMACPSCGATVQSDASFCGQCGFDLRTVTPAADSDEGVTTPEVTVPVAVPQLEQLEPLVSPDPLVTVPPSAEVTNLDPPPPAATTDAEAESSPVPPPVSAASGTSTQLQVSQIRLLHVQSETVVEIPSTLSLIRLGKPNDRVPPDIDVSGYPDSEVVSRVHANIRVEGDIYYIEDVGSSNGTYVNNMPLPYGNRHRLRPGDRISLGKGDKVSFIFQAS